MGTEQRGGVWGGARWERTGGEGKGHGGRGRGGAAREGREGESRFERLKKGGRLRWTGRLSAAEGKYEGELMGEGGVRGEIAVGGGELGRGKDEVWGSKRAGAGRGG